MSLNSLSIEVSSEFTESHKLALMAGRANPAYLLREEFCGACGVRHDNPSLLDLYPACRHCMSCLRYPEVLRKRFSAKDIQSLPLEIIAASYGHIHDSSLAADVTEACRSLVAKYDSHDRISFAFGHDIDALFSDPAPQKEKQIRIRYRMRQKFGLIIVLVSASNQVKKAVRLMAVPQRLLTIHRASYGHPKGRSSTGRMSYDVTETMQGLADVHGGSFLSIPHDQSLSSLLGDPCVGYNKDLVVEYEMEGTNGVEVLKETGGHISSRKDAIIGRLPVISPIISVESAFYGITPLGRKEKLAEISKFLARIRAVEYQMEQGLPISHADNLLRKQKHELEVEQNVYRNLHTHFIDITSKIQRIIETNVFHICLPKETFDPNLQFTNPSPGVRKLLEVNLRVVGHDSERRTSSVELTRGGSFCNYISATFQRFLIAVNDDVSGRGIMESSLNFSAKLAFPPVLVRNAVYGNLSVMAQAVDVTPEVQGMVTSHGLRIPKSLTLESVLENPCPGFCKKELRIDYTTRGFIGCVRLREKNDHLIGSLQLGYRTEVPADDFRR